MEIEEQSSNNIPTQFEPVLAEIEHITELGKSKWYEVVYYNEKWMCYAGSNTFYDAEEVVRWKYCKDLFPTIEH